MLQPRIQALHDASDLEAAFARLRAAASAAGLLGIEQGTSYGAPALRVQKKFLARIKDAATVSLYCPLEEKELLTGAAPDIYYETDHYKGWPGILVRLAAIGDEEPLHRLAIIWRMRADKRLVSRYDGSR